MKKLFLSLCLSVLFGIQVYSQDTVKVFMLVADTSHRYQSYTEVVSHAEAGCTDTTQFHRLFASHTREVKEDLGNGGTGNCYWIYGYEVSSMLFRNKYFDLNKIPLKEGIYVWMAKPLKNYY